ncbi:TPA: hypothetical protein ACJ29X_004319 [Salmonella enterica subsp. enterica serovar Enteritidis]|uniref:hypothetical protein n=1 Tax=Salmonella enterica TaxID=28901 RepID=UPI002016407D|nr:hypothetical protein [Salmonella enterica]
MDKLIFTITDAGRQEIINVSNTGTEKVEIKSVGIGDMYYITTPDQTEIGGEIKRITGIGGTVISPDTIHVSAKDDSKDEYVVHTVGLYTDKGTLFAVYSRKEPIINKSASTVMLISSDITFKSLDTANITFGDVVFINPPASESVVGVSRFATAEEVEEGLDPAIAVSAKRLKGELDKKANLDSPNLTGTPTAPTTAESDNSQKIATTAFIKQVLLAYAKLDSPNFTGKPTAPTAEQSSNDTQLATTAFVRSAIAALVDSSPGALDTLNELAAALGDDPNFATTMTNALAGKQPLDGTLTNLSGKDVPALLQYLGLVETINRAAGSLQKDQNGADIPDKPGFIKNLGLKETLNPTKRVSIGNIGNGAFDGSTPCINIGDSDSGFIGSADGVIDIYCNNAKVGYIDNSGLHMSVDVLSNGAIRAGNAKKLSLTSNNNSALTATFNLWGDPNRPTVIELDDDQGWHLYSQRNPDGSIVFTVNGDITANTLRAGGAIYQNNGDIFGSLWGNGWLSTWIHNNVVKAVRLGPVALSGGLWRDFQLGGGQVVTGFHTDGDWEMQGGDDKVYYRPVQYLVGDTWVTAASI